MSGKQFSLLTEKIRDFYENLFHLGVSLEQIKCEKTFTRIDWSCRVFTIVDTMEGINAIWCGYCRFSNK